ASAHRTLLTFRGVAVSATPPRKAPVGGSVAGFHPSRAFVLAFDRSNCREPDSARPPVLRRVEPRAAGLDRARRWAPLDHARLERLCRPAARAYRRPQGAREPDPDRIHR